MKKYLLLFLSAALLLSGCGKAADQDGKPDPENPVTITVLHYYNGDQKNAFDALVKEFNETEGAEKGIFIEGHNQGSVNQLEESILASIEKKPGSGPVPDIFASYADTAYAIEQMGLLVDLSQYMTQEEMDEYVASYIEEGRIGPNNELEIFPTAKSTEVFILNKTDWDKFAKATGASLDRLKTKESLAETAKEYYEWTDSLTPDILEDGKAFYGRDAMANLFIVGSMQLGKELFQVDNQKVTLNADRDIMKKIWDFYYVPYVKGYFSSYGKFRSDDVKIGEIIAHTGSSTSASYFPDFVETEEETYPIEALVLPVPDFEGGKPYAVQQGAGMVVTKSTKEREYAAVEFLKWFTEAERNVAFSCASGYLPVKKEAVNMDLLDAALKDSKEDNDLIFDSIKCGFETMETSDFYTNKAFDGGSNARKVLEYSLQDKAVKDRETVKEEIARGKTLEEAAAPFMTEDNFDQWFEEFKSQLEKCVEGQ